ncbi:MAG: signal recognition particle-docking protein FtsY [Nanoarchaeota archaeon]|nr:signal recognition particle-docking protein FtsY [Nanoarchaeota archaeon]
MFNKLREKLKNWATGLVKKAEPIGEPEKTERIKEIVKTPKKEKKFIEGSPEGTAASSFKESSLGEKTETISELIEETKTEIKPIEEHEYKEAEKREEIPEERELGGKVWEDIKQEEKSREKEEKKGFFKRLFSKITNVKIYEKDFDIYAEELETLLLENNVALEVAEKIIKELKEKIVGKELSKKEISSEINETFKETISEILIEPFDTLAQIKKFREDNPSKPYVILFCGINGSGKTTTIAKMAYFLKENNFSCVLAAGDTFRAASIEQLKKHGEKLEIEVIAHKYESDPASVGFDAIKYAEKKHIDCVLIDTAGRMHTAKNLMAQIEKISKVCKPNLKIFIGESITGNDAVEQVKSFDSSIGIDGIILTKADVDEKGGTALSVGYVTKKPILFLGTGQEYKDFEKFDKKKFVEKLGL